VRKFGVRAGSSAAVASGLVALLVLAGVDASAAPGPVAHGARTVSLQERGSLHLTGKGHPTINQTLNEAGRASGTIVGSLYIHLHLVSASKVTAEVNIYPSGGSLSGAGSASYHVVGGYAAFSGTLSITRGTGKYAHARASGLRFTGKIQRRDDSVSVQLSGPLSY
jgi:hypothetical protein